MQAKMLLKVMTVCRPNIGHGKQTGITFSHQKWNPAWGAFRKMPAVQLDSFCLKSVWTHTTAFPNQGCPMTHDRGVGLDRLLSLLIHLMTYLEKDNICQCIFASEMGVKTMRTSVSRVVKCPSSALAKQEVAERQMWRPPFDVCFMKTGHCLQFSHSGGAISQNAQVHRSTLSSLWKCSALKAFQLLSATHADQSDYCTTSRVSR